MFCESCPRRALEPGAKSSGERGPVEADLLFIGMAPGQNELGAIPFVGGSGKLLAQVFAHVRASGYSLPRFGWRDPDEDEVRVINCINCYPLKQVGAKAYISKEQFIACRSRFESELKMSHARIVVPLGGDALWYLTGIKGKKNGIASWRGYPIFPKDCLPVSAWPTQKALKEMVAGASDEATKAWADETLKRVKEKRVVLPPRAEIILPTLHPSYIMQTRFTQKPLLVKDIMRTARALNGGIKWVDVGENEGVPFGELASLPAQRPVGVSSDGTPLFDPITADIETVGFTTQIERISFAWKDVSGALKYGSYRWDLHVQEEARRLLGAKGVRKIFHNGMFDIPRLRLAGVEVEPPYDDTMWKHQVLQPELPKKLNDVASTWLDSIRWKHERPGRMKEKKCRLRRRKEENEGEYRDRVRQWESWRDVQLQLELPANEAKEKKYNTGDSQRTRLISDEEDKALARTGQVGLYQTMMEALPCLIGMLETGVAVDQEVRNEFTMRFARRAGVALREWLKASGGAAPDSWPQVHEVLYGKWGLPVQTRKRKSKDASDEKVSVSADAEALNDLLKMLPKRDWRARAIHGLQVHREYSKRLGYLAMLEGGTCHPTYGPVAKDDDEPGAKYTAGAATGRLTARHPPIQAWDKYMRRIFVPFDRENNVLLEGDYSNEELWIIAFLAKDEALLDALAVGDIHNQHAKLLNCDKTRAKNVVYSRIFRGGAKAAQHQLKQRGFMVEIEEIERLQKIIDKKYWRSMVWGDALLEQTRKLGYVVNPFGRRRYFYSVDGAFNEIVNFPVQSTGADMLWKIVPQVREVARAWAGRSPREPRIFVHDAAVIEVPKRLVREAATALRRVMEQPFNEVASGFHVPVKFKAGPNWYSMESVSPR